MHVTAAPKEGETVIGWGFDEPEDGGKATNQAIAAARLGAPVVLVTVIGNDHRGARARASLEQNGVDTRWIVEADGPTDVGFLMLPPSKIPAITTSLGRSNDLDKHVVARAAGVIASASSVVCQLEAPQGAAIEAFRLGREGGARTILNPAPARVLAEQLLLLTDVLVPNEHEAAALSGSAQEPERLASELARRWAPIDVVVTAGAAGAYVVERDGKGVIHILAPAVRPVVDTTGAGDAFTGALATRLREGDHLSVATEFAVRAASFSVSSPGTIPAFAGLADVELMVDRGT